MPQGAPLNQAIRHQHYKLPTGELFSEINNTNIHRKFDASSDFLQMKVDEELSKLLTFSTPFSRLRFKRLHYGIHSANEGFQQNIEEI